MPIQPMLIATSVTGRQQQLLREELPLSIMYGLIRQPPKPIPVYAQELTMLPLQMPVEIPVRLELPLFKPVETEQLA